MSNNGCFFTFYTLTPLHAGAGDSAGAIDLPVQRERHTEYPVVHSSGMKGSLRDFFERKAASLEGASRDEERRKIETIFGKEGDEQGSGKVIFTDAKILLFPVRSSEGVFKWITCPFVIERLKSDLKLIGISICDVSAAENTAFKEYQNIILEDFSVSASDCSASSASLLNFLKSLTVPHFAEDILKERIVIVSDDLFKTLVTTATQIIARNVLENETKKSKSLWYEEVVPADVLFYTIMLPAYRGNTAIDNLETGVNGEVLQIGGNETIGYGIVKWSNELTDALGTRATQGNQTQGGGT